MHVLQLGPYPPPEGGINRNILAIREELLKSGYQCSIIATSRSTRITHEPDVYHPRSPFELIRLLFSLKYDLLHLHVGGNISTRVLGLIFACGFFKGGKNIFTLHSGGYPSSKEGQAARSGSLRGFLFRRFARVIAVNPLIAEVFERYGINPDKIKVIYPFVHRAPDPDVKVPDELDAFVRGHSPFLLTVGQLEDEYDLFMQIDAMEKVLQTSPNAGLMIIGSGSLEEKLRAAIIEKPYADRIFLAGDVEHANTIHLINAADVLLRTTLFDGDAISVREALFLNTPVIATDNGMRPDGLNLIPIHDAEALVRHIQAVAGQKKMEKTPLVADNSNIKAVVDVYAEIA